VEPSRIHLHERCCNEQVSEHRCNIDFCTSGKLHIYVTTGAHICSWAVSASRGKIANIFQVGDIEQLLGLGNSSLFRAPLPCLVSIACQASPEVRISLRSLDHAHLKFVCPVSMYIMHAR